MKKNFMFAMICAIALTGAVGITSCSSSDEVTAEVNPTYDPAVNTVNVQFVLNVATAPNQFTRQSDETVQRDQNFRGIQNVTLVGLATGNPGVLAPYLGGTTTTDWDATSGIKAKFYDLGTLYGSSAVSNEGTNNRENSSRRVLQLSMPIATDAMLVYGRAIPNPDTEENGKVTMTIGTAPENITFKLNQRLVEGRVNEYNQTCDLAVTILNRIISSNIGEHAAGTRTINGYTNVGALPAITWQELGTSTASLAPLEEILANAFKTLTTINTGEYRAGSSSAISSIAFYVYNISKSVYNATATGDKELNAQILANEIMRRIDNYFEKYDDASATEEQTAFLDVSVIKEHMMTATGMTSTQFDNQFGLVQHGDLKAFPASFGLPYGVALLDYNATDNVFSHRVTNTSLLQDGNLAEDHYMYPAELMYFDNSALRVNNNTVAATAYPNGYGTWDTAASWPTGWTTGTVSSSTRSVAVKNNINYGVAMLQTKVALDGTSFNDNRNEITGEPDQTLTEAQVKQFRLTGVLVGNQNPELGWNYLAKTSSATDWNYVVYDNKVASGTIPTAAGEENYTLLFDNYLPGGGSQTTEVLVALEFKNEGNDFYGLGNMIRAGGTFYLVGKLKTVPETTNANHHYTGTGTITWPTTYAIPPYTAAGASQEITRVFIQDFMTTATFKIGLNSLKSAYVTVPDLRSSQTSLGLSVNLEWQTGLDFETLLGAD
jgi:hypothetical protein